MRIEQFGRAPRHLAQRRHPRASDRHVAAHRLEDRAARTPPRTTRSTNTRASRYSPSSSESDTHSGSRTVHAELARQRRAPASSYGVGAPGMHEQRPRLGDLRERTRPRP